MTLEQVSGELLSLLTKSKMLLHSILDKEDDKFEALRILDINELIKTNMKEELLLSSFDQVEEKRLLCVEHLCHLVGLDSSAPLSEIVEHLPQEKDELLKTAQEIKTLTERMSIAADRNRYILESNTEIITSILDLMSGNTSSHYDEKGENTTEKHKLHMIDHTV